MAKLFLDVLNLSIAASWLIFAVLILRFVLKRFVPKWTLCLVWVLVGIRLVIPFSFESELSLVPSRETVNTSVLLNTEEKQTPSDVPSAEESIFVSEAPPSEKPTETFPQTESTLPSISTPPQKYIDSGFEQIDKTVNPIIQNAVEDNRNKAENTEHKWLSVASFIWLFGIFVMLAYAVINYILLKRRISAFVPEENGVRKSENVVSPFILGVFKPRIYLPFGLSEENERNIIAHERAHLARGDHLIKPFGFAVLAFYWFNPLCWIAYIILCRDIELACDEKVVRNMDIEARKGYANALLECGMKKSFISACPVAFGEVGIKERVVNALNYKKPIFRIIIVAIILITAVALLFLTNPSEDESFSSDISSSEEGIDGSDEPTDQDSSDIESEEFNNSSESLNSESSEISSEAVEDSSDVSETSGNVSDGSNESSEESSEFSEDSSEMVENSSEVVEDSSEAANDSSDAPADSNEVTEDSNDASEDEASDSETSEPEISESEISEPEISEPEVSEPESPMKNTSRQTPDVFEPHYGTAPGAVRAYVRISDVEIATYGGGEEDALVKEYGLKVWLCDTRGNKIDYVYTNSDGVALFYLEEGLYRFAFEGNGKYASVITTDTFGARKDKRSYGSISPDEVIINTFREIYNKNLTITVTDIETGEPLKDVQCTVGEYLGKASTTTDENGIAVLPPAMQFYSRDRFICAKFECEGYETYECWEIAIRDSEAYIRLRKVQE